MQLAGGVLLRPRPLNRPRPMGPVHAYQSYEIRSPLPTHWRPAKCAEVGCPNADGWVIRVDEATQLGRAQARYIRLEAERRYRERRDPRGLTVFTFAAGQRCFTGHMVPLGRPELYVVRGGDWRANLGVIRRHTRPEHWTEDLAERLDQIATIRKRG